MLFTVQKSCGASEDSDFCIFPQSECHCRVLDAHTVCCILQNNKCTVYRIRCKMYIIQYTVCNIQCTMYFYILHSVSATFECPPHTTRDLHKGRHFYCERKRYFLKSQLSYWDNFTVTQTIN